MEAKELAFTKKRVDRPSIFLAGGKWKLMHKNVDLFIDVVVAIWRNLFWISSKKYEAKSVCQREHDEELLKHE
jgi:hypothetical protein